MAKTSGLLRVRPNQVEIERRKAVLVQNARNILLSTCIGNKSQLTVGASVVGCWLGMWVGDDEGDAVVGIWVGGDEGDAVIGLPDGFMNKRLREME